MGGLDNPLETMSPVYEHLKGIFAYARNKESTPLKKMST